MVTGGTFKIFVEGGGNRTLNSELAEAFQKLSISAGLDGRLPRFVACGSRNSAFDDFCTAVANGEKAMLLVDAEAAVSAQHCTGDATVWSPWGHLAIRDSDASWRQPTGSSENCCHLMVIAMEAWLLADPKALTLYYGSGFNVEKLPKKPIETISKSEMEKSLSDATAGLKTKDSYHKGRDSFKILKLVSAGTLENASPWAKRFFDELRNRT